MSNIKLVIQISDIHIRCFQRLDEYEEQLSKFIEKCQEITAPYKKEEVRIAVCGDLVHQKNTLSSELIVFASNFIRQLEELGTVIVIAGNHDLILRNQTRKDAITALFETAAFQNAYLLDYELEYQSGYLVDNNITWVLYSIYTDYQAPTIDDVIKEYPNNKVIGLYHGMIVGSQLNNGTVVDSGVDGNLFKGCDIVMAGDIHKRQELKRGKTTIVYPGSLIQQNFGETLTQHGFVVWDIEKNTHEYIDLPSEYGLYDFRIKSYDDIDEDIEELINY